MLAIAWIFAVTPGSAKKHHAPELLSFMTVRILGNWWLLYGEFDDATPEDCIIDFGGIMAGHSTMGDADGTFSYCTMVPPRAAGTVTAQVLDPSNQRSNVLEDVVDRRQRSSNP